MAERRLLFIRISLFLLMLLCFSLQSLDNFEKYLEGKTSISESEISKPEFALPSFSVCSDPSFDVAFMKQYNVSPNLFLGSYRISFLSHNYQFPANLNQDSLTLQKYWSSNALTPRKFSIGEDTVSLTQLGGEEDIGGKYLVFVSSHSVKMRELSFAQFVYFLGNVCLFFNF